MAMNRYFFEFQPTVAITLAILLINLPTCQLAECPNGAIDVSGNDQSLEISSSCRFNVTARPGQLIYITTANAEEPSVDFIINTVNHTFEDGVGFLSEGYTANLVSAGNSTNLLMKAIGCPISDDLVEFEEVSIYYGVASRYPVWNIVAECGSTNSTFTNLTCDFIESEILDWKCAAAVDVSATENSTPNSPEWRCRWDDCGRWIVLAFGLGLGLVLLIIVIVVVKKKPAMKSCWNSAQPDREDMPMGRPSVNPSTATRAGLYQEVEPLSTMKSTPESKSIVSTTVTSTPDNLYAPVNKVVNKREEIKMLSLVENELYESGPAMTIAPIIPPKLFLPAEDLLSPDKQIYSEIGEHI